MNYLFWRSIFSLIVTVVALAACGGGGSSSGEVTSTPPVTLSSIAITPVSATLAKGTTASLTATGTFSDNSTADITAQVKWTSADTATASVGAPPGTVTGVAIGSTTVTASMSGITSPAVNITVTAATLTSITVSPVAASIPKGATTTFTAMGIYSDASTGDISGSVSWNSSNIAVATLNASGIATGNGIGMSYITASLNGVTSNIATLTVSAPVIASIAITPASPIIMVGSTVNLIATATYTDATTADVTTVANWNSSSPGIATVGLNTGVATGVAVGTTIVTATTGGITSSGLTLTVTPYVPPTCTWDISTWDNCVFGS